MTVSEIQPQTIRAHEVYGDFWFNSEPVLISALRGKVVLVQFWDCTCVGSVHAISYMNEWSRKYEEYGLVAIGVHTPKFPFGRDPEVVQRAIERHSIRYPVVMDNEGTIANNYGSRSWPSFFLIDKHGFIRCHSSSDGNYGNLERVLQALLYDAGADEELPLPMEPLRLEDKAGVLCYKSTPELFAGYVRGSIGNVEGFSPESVVEYADPNLYVHDRIYAVGAWLNERNSLRHQTTEDGQIILSYRAREVNAVIKKETAEECVVFLKQDGVSLTAGNRGDDVRIDAGGNSILKIDEPRMYSIVKNREYGEHVLKLTTAGDGFSLYSFSFVTSVIPELLFKN